jgi:hypothetical protein|tara:strand:- start:456 stop:668 length:213 start_codon:yes stop_codon:yes gene_type:complete
MPNYNNSTLDDAAFQRNDKVGVSWRKRYVKENGGKFVRSGDTWSWSGGASVKTSVPKLTAVRKVFRNEDV